MMDWIQIIIFVISSSAVWLVSRKEEWSKWGYVLGLIGQPFWFITTIHNEQWGMVLLCLFYTYSWAQGIWFHIIKANKEKKADINDHGIQLVANRISHQMVQY